ncbi:MAG TPA: Amuc_1102 family pilus-like protein [Chthoniobacterales bacterium]
MIRHLFLAAAFAISIAPSVFAQNSPLKITDIKATLEKSPEFTIGVGPQRKATSQDWLWVEVSYIYQATVRNAPPIEPSFTYYILFNNPTPQNRTGTLLSGTVVHTGVTAGGAGDVHHSVMLVSPQTLRSLFDGKAPTSVAAATQAIGVTVSVNGQLADEMSVGKAKGRKQWWVSLPQGAPGLVLTKDQTPFAPLFYDYFDAVKAKSSGY